MVFDNDNLAYYLHVEPDSPLGRGGGVGSFREVTLAGKVSLPSGGALVTPSYHGKASFDSFSHYKTVLTKSFLLDLNVRYPPYQGKLKLLKWLIG